METFILEKKERTVQIEGRKFILREMGAERFRNYTLKLVEISKAIKDIASRRSVDTKNSENAKAEEELLSIILSEPIDPDKPADSNFLQSLSFSQRLGLFKIQDELNGTEELLKKIQNLLV